MTQESRDRASFFPALVGDGRPMLFAVAGALIFAGGFAVFLAATGEFLPHDIHYLGLSADDLCAVASCRIVDFMIHDRAAFGGTLIGVGVLYSWLTAFPLARGEQWAWWTLLASGTVGFLSFLSYLGYGYLDSWHGIGTLLVLPVFAVGMVLSRSLVREPLRVTCLLRPGGWTAHRDRFGAGRAILLAGAAGAAVGGLTILYVGVTDTFVPQDLEFMGLSAAQIRAISPRLVSLIAHDRAGFGGGVLTMGLTSTLCLWCARPSRHLHQAIATAGALSLGPAIGVHLAVGYTDFGHLLPALAAAASLVIGLALAYPGIERAHDASSRRDSQPTAASADQS